MSVDPVAQRRVALLYRRAGFGASLDTVNQWAAQGYTAAVDNLLAFAPAAGRPDNAEVVYLQEQAQLADSLSSTNRNIVPDEQWWINRMATTAYPLEEKLTLYWHGHFANAFNKVFTLGYMIGQNRTLRENAGGDFRQLCNLMTADLAMLIFLDGNWSRIGVPNENYAREFMELFTLGKDQYSQTDVTQVARAFTGYGIPSYNTVKFYATLHDSGLKTILGNGPANYGATDVTNIVLDHHPKGNVAAQYVAQRVASFFHRPSPEAAVVQAMAAAFTGAAGQPYPIKAMLRALFLRPEFMDDTLTTIKCPAELVAGAVAALGMAQTEVGTSTSDTSFATATRSMGQELFNPPNVAGWKGGTTWANTATTLARYNFAARLASQVASNTVQATLDQAQGVPRNTVAVWMARLGLLQLSSTTSPAITTYLDAATKAGDTATTLTRGILTLLLASPDYNLR